MTDRVVRKLNFTRKLLLGTAACLALALPVVFGLLKVTPAHASGNPLDQFAGSWESKYQGRAFFTLNMVVKDGLLTGTAVHSTRITSQNGELVPDSDDSATDKVLEAHVADKKLLLKIEDPGDPSAPMPLELRLTAENEAEGRLVTDGQSGVPQQTKPWRFVRVSDVESQGSSTPHFSSVSIKSHPAENQGFMTQKMMIAPVKNGGEISVRGVSLHSMIRTAYRVQESQIVAEPDWVKTERYDIDAKLDPSIAEQARKLSDAEDRLMAQQMMQQFLAEYFKVSVHQEVQDQPVYELVVTDGGSKLQPVQDPNKKAMMRMGLGELNSEGTPLDLLVAQLSQRLGRTVVDKTGLKGNYIFNLHWTPDADEQARIRAAAPGLPEPGVEKPSASGPPLMTAVEEQLGLKLQPTTERVPVLIIDHAEQPAQN